jgi:hypothetical protein
VAASSIHVTIRVPRWRVRLAMLVVDLYILAEALGLHRPRVREADAIAGRLASWMMKGATHNGRPLRGKRRRRVRAIAS